MSTNTLNYNMFKPELSDPADITKMNPNWDTIDSELKRLDLLGEDDKILPEYLPEIQSSSTTSATLLVNEWALGSDGRYYQTILVEDVTVDTEFVIVDCDLTTDDADARVEILSAWEAPSANEVDQGNGTLTFHSYTIPTVSIPIFVGVA